MKHNQTKTMKDIEHLLKRGAKTTSPNGNHIEYPYNAYTTFFSHKE